MIDSRVAMLAIELDVSLVDVPSARIAEAWTEDDGVIGIIDALCRILHDEEAATFRVEFAGEAWPVDVETDLAVFLVELPNLVHGIRTATYCEINFYEQGLQRFLYFTPHRDGWAVQANTGEVSWDPPSEIAQVETAELARIVRRIEATMRDVVAAIDPTLANDVFQEWLASISLGPA